MDDLRSSALSYLLRVLWMTLSIRRWNTFFLILRKIAEKLKADKTLRLSSSAEDEKCLKIDNQDEEP